MSGGVPKSVRQARMGRFNRQTGLKLQGDSNRIDLTTTAKRAIKRRVQSTFKLGPTYPTEYRCENGVDPLTASEQALEEHCYKLDQPGIVYLPEAPWGQSAAGGVGNKYNPRRKCGGSCFTGPDHPHIRPSKPSKPSSKKPCLVCDNLRPFPITKNKDNYSFTLDWDNPDVSEADTTDELPKYLKINIYIKKTDGSTILYETFKQQFDKNEKNHHGSHSNIILDYGKYYSIDIQTICQNGDTETSDSITVYEPKPLPPVIPPIDPSKNYIVDCSQIYNENNFGKLSVKVINDDSKNLIGFNLSIDTLQSNDDYIKYLSVIDSWEISVINKKVSDPSGTPSSDYLKFTHIVQGKDGKKINETNETISIANNWKVDAKTGSINTKDPITTPSKVVKRLLSLIKNESTPINNSIDTYGIKNCPPVINKDLTFIVVANLIENTTCNYEQIDTIPLSIGNIKPCNPTPTPGKEDCSSCTITDWIPSENLSPFTYQGGPGTDIYGIFINCKSSMVKNVNCISFWQITLKDPIGSTVDFKYNNTDVSNIKIFPDNSDNVLSFMILNKNDSQDNNFPSDTVYIAPTLKPDTTYTVYIEAIPKITTTCPNALEKEFKCKTGSGKCSSTNYIPSFSIEPLCSTNVNYNDYGIEVDFDNLDIPQKYKNNIVNYKLTLFDSSNSNMTIWEASGNTLDISVNEFNYPLKTFRIRKDPLGNSNYKEYETNITTYFLKNNDMKPDKDYKLEVEVNLKNIDCSNTIIKVNHTGTSGDNCVAPPLPPLPQLTGKPQMYLTSYGMSTYKELGEMTGSALLNYYDSQAYKGATNYEVFWSDINNYMEKYSNHLFNFVMKPSIRENLVNLMILIGDYQMLLPPYLKKDLKNGNMIYREDSFTPNTYYLPYCKDISNSYPPIGTNPTSYSITIDPYSGTLGYTAPQGATDFGLPQYKKQTNPRWGWNDLINKFDICGNNIMDSTKRINNTIILELIIPLAIKLKNESIKTLNTKIKTNQIELTVNADIATGDGAWGCWDAGSWTKEKYEDRIIKVDSQPDSYAIGGILPNNDPSSNTLCTPDAQAMAPKIPYFTFSPFNSNGQVYDASEILQNINNSNAKTLKKNVTKWSDEVAFPKTLFFKPSYNTTVTLPDASSYTFNNISSWITLEDTNDIEVGHYILPNYSKGESGPPSTFVKVCETSGNQIRVSITDDENKTVDLSYNLTDTSNCIFTFFNTNGNCILGDGSDGTTIDSSGNRKTAEGCGRSTYFLDPSDVILNDFEFQWKEKDASGNQIKPENRDPVLVCYDISYSSINPGIKKDLMVLVTNPNSADKISHSEYVKVAPEILKDTFYQWGSSYKPGINSFPLDNLHQYFITVYFINQKIMEINYNIIHNGLKFTGAWTKDDLLPLITHVHSDRESASPYTNENQAFYPSCDQSGNIQKNVNNYGFSIDPSKCGLGNAVGMGYWKYLYNKYMPASCLPDWRLENNSSVPNYMTPTLGKGITRVPNTHHILWDQSKPWNKNQWRNFHEDASGNKGWRVTSNNFASRKKRNPITGNAYKNDGIQRYQTGYINYKTTAFQGYADPTQGTLARTGEGILEAWQELYNIGEVKQPMAKANVKGDLAESGELELPDNFITSVNYSNNKISITYGDDYTIPTQLIKRTDEQRILSNVIPSSESTGKFKFNSKLGGGFIPGSSLYLPKLNKGVTLPLYFKLNSIYNSFIARVAKAHGYYTSSWDIDRGLEKMLGLSATCDGGQSPAITDIWQRQLAINTGTVPFDGRGFNENSVYYGATDWTKFSVDVSNNLPSSFTSSTLYSLGYKRVAGGYLLNPSKETDGFYLPIEAPFVKINTTNPTIHDPSNGAIDLSGVYNYKPPNNVSYDSKSKLQGHNLGDEWKNKKTVDSGPQEAIATFSFEYQGGALGVSAANPMPNSIDDTGPKVNIQKWEKLGGANAVWPNINEPSKIKSGIISDACFTTQGRTFDVELYSEMSTYFKKNPNPANNQTTNPYGPLHIAPNKSTDIDYFYAGDIIDNSKNPVEPGPDQYNLYAGWTSQSTNLGGETNLLSVLQLNNDSGNTTKQPDGFGMMQSFLNAAATSMIGDQTDSSGNQLYNLSNIKVGLYSIEFIPESWVATSSKAGSNLVLM